jgi:hypothetical protein
LLDCKWNAKPEIETAPVKSEAVNEETPAANSEAVTEETPAANSEAVVEETPAANSEAVVEENPVSESEAVTEKNLPAKSDVVTDKTPPAKIEGRCEFRELPQKKEVSIETFISEKRYLACENSEKYCSAIDKKNGNMEFGFNLASD